MRRLRLVRVYKNVKADGGVQSRLREILPRLAVHLDVRVLCYRDRGDRAGELETAGIPVDLIPLGAKWAPWNVGRYVAYFQRHQPDIVHTHEYTANTLAIAAARKAGVLVRVRHLHTLAPWGWGGPLRTGLRMRADRRAARTAQMTLAVSRAVRSHYLAVTGLPADSCRVLYNGIDLSRFQDCRERGSRLRAEWGMGAAPLVGMVGRLSRGKGHREFLATARRVADRLPAARFAVVGGGGQKAELEAYARELGLTDRVLFTGHRDDVPAVCGALDLFLFTSGADARGRIQDGLPGVVIEAQAAGVPVVGFRLPMMEELVQHGVTGELVDEGNLDALAATAVEYLVDGERRSRAAVAARRSAKRFSLEACVTETLAMYEELVRKTGGTP